MRKLPTIGTIVNHGGVINLGEIHGNVVAGIRQQLREQPQDDPRTQVLQSLLALADDVRANQAQIEFPDKSLQNITDLAEIVKSPQPEPSLVERALASLTLGIAHIQPLLSRVLQIKSLVTSIVS